MEEITHVDVLIVGSGPAGSSVALHLLKDNPSWAQRILMIDKAVHPRDKLCGGGLTHLAQNIVRDLGLELEPAHFPVREVRLAYQELAYSFRGNPVFRIVRRREFDHWLVQKIETAGVTVFQGEAVTAIEAQQEWVEVTTERRVIRAKVVVAADGSRSFVRTHLKWHDDSRVSRLIEVDTPENPQIDLHFRQGIAEFDFSMMTEGVQGYYWDFPSYVAGEPIMNRGMFDSRTHKDRPKADLKQSFRTLLAQRKRDLDHYQLKGHPLRWFDAKGQFSQPRVLLAGDAAGADPLFGEGISFALGYGRPIARAIIQAFQTQQFSFDNYKALLLAEPLFKHLVLRVRLAKIAYRINSPRILRLGWRVANRFIRWTRWNDPKFVPPLERL